LHVSIVIAILNIITMSSEADAEETIIEYARFHGLTSDYLAEPLPFSDIEALRELGENRPSDDTGLTQIQYRPPSITDERLTVDKGAARLLAGANDGFLNPKALNDTITGLLDCRRPRKLELELPVLRTEPDFDFAAFKRHSLEEIEMFLCHLSQLMMREMRVLDGPRA
jgi:hypothetical protein